MANVIDIPKKRKRKTKGSTAYAVILPLISSQFHYTKFKQVVTDLNLASTTKSKWLSMKR